MHKRQDRRAAPIPISSSEEMLSNSNGIWKFSTPRNCNLRSRPPPVTRQYNNVDTSDEALGFQRLNSQTGTETFRGLSTHCVTRLLRSQILMSQLGWVIRPVTAVAGTDVRAGMGDMTSYCGRRYWCQSWDGWYDPLLRSQVLMSDITYVYRNVDSDHLQTGRSKEISDAWIFCTNDDLEIILQWLTVKMTALRSFRNVGNHSFKNTTSLPDDTFSHTAVVTSNIEYEYHFEMHVKDKRQRIGEHVCVHVCHTTGNLICPDCKASCSYLQRSFICEVILFWSEVSYVQVLRDKINMYEYIRVTLYWGYLIVLW